MNRPEHLDLFEFSDRVLEKLNLEGNTCLSHHDIYFKIRRDTNFPSDKIDIYLYVFNEEFSKTYYDIEYHSFNKIIDILFIHAVDDYGYSDIRNGLISVKMQSLEKRFFETSKCITEMINIKFESRNVEDLKIFVDEQFPYQSLDITGLPLFQLNILSHQCNLDFKFPLQSSSNVYINQNEIVDKFGIFLNKP